MRRTRPLSDFPSITGTWRGWFLYIARRVLNGNWWGRSTEWMSCIWSRTPESKVKNKICDFIKTVWANFFCEIRPNSNVNIGLLGLQKRGFFFFWVSRVTGLSMSASIVETAIYNGRMYVMYPPLQSFFFIWSGFEEWASERSRFLLFVEGRNGLRYFF